MEFKTSKFERILEALLYPGLVIIPYLLFREFLVSVARSNPWIFIYMTSFAAIATIAVAMPYVISDFKKEKKTFPTAFTAITIAAGVGMPIINIFSKSPIALLSLVFLAAAAILVLVYIVLDSDIKNPFDLAFSLMVLAALAIPYIAGNIILISAQGQVPLSETIYLQLRNFALVSIAAMPLAAPLPYMLRGDGEDGGPLNHIISLGAAIAAPLIAYGAINIFQNSGSAGNIKILIVMAGLALAALLFSIILSEIRSTAEKSVRPLTRITAMYITSALAYSTYFVLFNSFESFRLPQQTIMQITGAFIILLFFMSSLIKGRLEIRKTPFNLPILFITVLSLFSFVLSPNFFISLKDFSQYIFVVLTFYLILHTLDAKRHYNALIATFLVVMGIEAFIGVTQHFGANRLVGLGDNYDPFSTLGNKNYVAEMLAMTIPLALAVSIASREWWKKLLCWLAIAPMLIVVLVSVTRGSWIGVIAASFVFVIYAIDGLPKKKAIETVAHVAGLFALALVIMFMSTNRIIFHSPDYSYASRFLSIVGTLQGQLAKTPAAWIGFFGAFGAAIAGVFFILHRKSARLIGAGLIASVMIVTAIYAAPRQNAQPQQRTVQKTQSELVPTVRVEDSIVSRRFIWGGTKEMIRRYPFGVGLGAYKIRYLSMLKAYLRDSKQTSIPGFFKDVNAKEAHNEYLHTWAELGPLAPIFLLFFFITLVRLFYLTYYGPGGDDYTKIVALGSFCGLISIGASAVFGFPFHIIGTSMFCGVFLVLLVFSEDRRAGISTLPVLLPGFKSARQQYPMQTQKTSSVKKKKSKQQEVPKPVPIDTSWRKSWLVANIGRGWGIAGYIFFVFFFIALTYISYCVQMANITVKDANNMAKMAATKEQADVTLAMYDKSLAQDPYNGDIHLFRGMFFQGQNRNDDALEEFLEARKYYDLPQISLDIGAIYFEKGGQYYGKAEQLFKESLAVYPNYHFPRFNLGLIYYQEGLNILDASGISSLDQAPAAAAAAGSTMNSKDSTFEQKGTTSLQQAREYFIKATEMFIESLKIDPKLDSASFKLALTYEKLGDIDRAMQWYLYTIKINPNHYDAYYNYGLVLIHKSTILNSQADQAAKAGQTDYAHALYASASELQNESMREFEKAVSVSPDHVKSLNNLGNIYFNQGKVKEALNLYMQALKTDPTYLNARLNISLAYIHMNQFENALPYLLDLENRALDPPFEIKTVFMIATCYIGLRRPGEAETLLERVVTKYGNTQYSSQPEFISAAIRYGQVLDLTGNPRKGAEVLSSLLSRPLSPYLEAEVLYRYGAAAANSGQYADAKSAFNKLLSRFPRSEFTPQAKNALQKIGSK
jgi:tetratricopeptide (TPR) repeat protein/O-antigen ligase